MNRKKNGKNNDLQHTAKQNLSAVSPEFIPAEFDRVDACEEEINMGFDVIPENTGRKKNGSSDYYSGK